MSEGYAEYCGHRCHTKLNNCILSQIKGEVLITPKETVIFFKKMKGTRKEHYETVKYLVLPL